MVSGIFFFLPDNLWWDLLFIQKIDFFSWFVIMLLRFVSTMPNFRQRMSNQQCHFQDDHAVLTLSQQLSLHDALDEEYYFSDSYHSQEVRLFKVLWLCNSFSLIHFVHKKMNIRWKVFFLYLLATDRIKQLKARFILLWCNSLRWWRRIQVP